MKVELKLKDKDGNLIIPKAPQDKDLQIKELEDKLKVMQEQISILEDKNANYEDQLRLYEKCHHDIQCLIADRGSNMSVGAALDRIENTEGILRKTEYQLESLHEEANVLQQEFDELEL